MTTTILRKFENSEYGIEVVVAKIEKGFSVVIRDTDAELYVSTVRIFPTLDAALAEAQRVAS